MATLLDGFAVPGGDAGALAESVIDTDTSTARRFLVMGLGGPLLVTQGIGGSVRPYFEDVVDWDVFMRHVRPWASACPLPVITDHCIQATREFCAFTRVWRVRADAPPVRAGVTTYPLLLKGAEAVRLNGATVGDAHHTTEFEPSAPRELEADVRAGSTRRQVSLASEEEVHVAGGNPGDRVTLELVLKPALDAPGLPKRLAPYIDAIAHGAVASLCLLPRQPWSDAALAATKRRLFIDAANTLGHTVERGNSSARRRVPQRFF